MSWEIRELYGREAAHPPLVTPSLWQAVQDRLARNGRLRRASRSSYMLTGLLTCRVCGQGYAGGGGPKNARRKFYRDSGGISGACPGKIGTVMRHIVEDAAVRMIGETLAGIGPELNRAMEDALQPTDVDPRPVRARRAKLEGQRDRLLGAIADGAVRAAEAADRLEAIRAGIARTDAELHGLRFEGRRTDALYQERDRFLQAAADFPALAARLEGPALRDLVEPWIGRATFDKRTRDLVLGIRSMPLLSSTWPGPDGQENRLIVRRASLLQPGHSYRLVGA